MPFAGVRWVPGTAVREHLARWWQPSLSRRVLLALLLAFVLVAAVLVAVDYIAFRLDTDQRQLRRDGAQAMVQTLPADDAGARQILQAGEHQYNYLRRHAEPDRAEQLGDLLWLLTDARDGRRVYASAPLQQQPLTAQASPVTRVEVAGRRYQVVQARAAHWHLQLFEPLVDDVTALQWLLENAIGSIVIAFPVVLLPVWLAVRRALLPLRQMVAAVSQREAGDFSPLPLKLHLAELKPLGQTLDELLRRSRDAVARERGIVQDAAHELRTPLAVIAAQAHVLAGAPDGQARQAALQRLEQAIARASHLVHQVLTLARVEGSVARLPQRVDVVATLRQALVDVDPQARTRGVELALEAPEQLWAWLDPVALHSILDNLLNNALQHAQGASRVQVTLLVQGPNLHLTVRDDGAGIDERDREQLFERFHRGRGATARGSGLGLSIVRQAARQLGGEVDLQTGLDDRGAGFEVRLPWQAALPDAHPTHR